MNSWDTGLASPAARGDFAKELKPKGPHVLWKSLQKKNKSFKRQSKSNHGLLNASFLAREKLRHLKKNTQEENGQPRRSHCLPCPLGPGCYCYLCFGVSFPLPVFTSKPHLFFSPCPFTVWSGAVQKKRDRRCLYSVQPSWTCPGHSPQMLKEFSSSPLPVFDLIVILKTYFLMYLCTSKHISVPLLPTESSPLLYRTLQYIWIHAVSHLALIFRTFSPYFTLHINPFFLQPSFCLWCSSAFLSLVCIAFAIQSSI